MGCQHNLKSNPTHHPLQHLGRRWHGQRNGKSTQAQSFTQTLTLQGQTGTAEGLAQGCWEGTGGYLEMGKSFLTRKLFQRENFSCKITWEMLMSGHGPGALSQITRDFTVLSNIKPKLNGCSLPTCAPYPGISKVPIWANPLLRGRARPSREAFSARTLSCELRKEKHIRETRLWMLSSLDCS